MARQLIKDSAIYGFGALLSKSLGFLLIPLYTRYLDVSEYGSLALLNLILQVVSFVCLLGISTAAMRLYYDRDADDSQRSGVYGNATALLLVLPPAVLLVLAPAIWALSEAYLTSIPFFPYIFTVVLIGLFTPLEKLMSGLLRVQRRPVSFVAFNVAFFLFQTLTIVIAVAVLQYGLKGQLYAQLIANIVFSIAALVILVRFSRPSFSAPLSIRMLKFGVPLVPFFILTWVSTSAARFALEHYTTLVDVGLFALAAQFAGLMLIASTALDNAMMPYFLERAGDERAAAELGLLVTRYVAFFGMVGLGIVVAAGPVILLVAQPAYHGAIAYVAPLVIATWLFVARRPVVWSFTHTARSATLSTVQAVSVAILVALLAVFLGVWHMGVMGAIYATAGANVFFLAAGYAASRLGFALGIPWRRFLPMLTVLSGAFVAIVAMGNTGHIDPLMTSLQILVLLAATIVTARIVGIRNLRALLRP